MSCQWLLLRGWVREQKHWANFPEVFAARTGAKVFALDLPGTGTEFKRSSPTRIEGIVDDLRSRIDFKNTGKLGVLALSMGGMIALDWTTRYPEDFERLVLVNASVGSLSYPWERMRLSSVPKIFNAIVARGEQEREERILQLTTKLSDQKREELARISAEIAKARPITYATMFRQLSAAVRFRPAVFPRLPSLVITSRGDDLVSSACSIRLAGKLEASSLLIHPTGGHDLVLDDPQWISDAIFKWLQST